MNRCKTCKWWDKTPDEHYNYVECGFGRCRHYLTSDGIREDAGMWNIYGEGYQVCGPDFGCIHHEEKA